MRTRLTHTGIVLTLALMSLAPQHLYAEEQPHMQAALQHLRAAAEELRSRMERDHDQRRPRRSCRTQYKKARAGKNRGPNDQR